MNLEKSILVSKIWQKNFSNKNSKTEKQLTGRWQFCEIINFPFTKLSFINIALFSFHWNKSISSNNFVTYIWKSIQVHRLKSTQQKASFAIKLTAQLTTKNTYHSFEERRKKRNYLWKNSQFYWQNNKLRLYKIDHQILVDS